MADAILKQVITRWSPRIVNNSVDMNDDHWTVDGLEQWASGTAPRWPSAASTRTWRARRRHRAMRSPRGMPIAYLRAAVAYHFGAF